jgi:hypothetical protein
MGERMIELYLPGLAGCHEVLQGGGGGGGEGGGGDGGRVDR